MRLEIASKVSRYVESYAVSNSAAGRRRAVWVDHEALGIVGVILNKATMQVRVEPFSFAKYPG